MKQNPCGDAESLPSAPRAKPGSEYPALTQPEKELCQASKLLENEISAATHDAQQQSGEQNGRDLPLDATRRACTDDGVCPVRYVCVIWLCVCTAGAGFRLFML